MTKQEIKDKALKHIERCDEIFDGKMWIADKEFAYLEMRVLALELLEMVLETEQHHADDFALGPFHDAGG
jgi:hypothetical protein